MAMSVFIADVLEILTFSQVIGVVRLLYMYGT